MEQRKRMRARIAEEDYKLSPSVEPKESLETWQKVISATWDMTIVAVAYNDMRIPLRRVPETLETLETEISRVRVGEAAGSDHCAPVRRSPSCPKVPVATITPSK